MRMREFHCCSIICRFCNLYRGKWETLLITNGVQTGVSIDERSSKRSNAPGTQSLSHIPHIHDTEALGVTNARFTEESKLPNGHRSAKASQTGAGHSHGTQRDFQNSSAIRFCFKARNCPPAIRKHSALVVGILGVSSFESLMTKMTKITSRKRRQFSNEKKLLASYD